MAAHSSRNAIGPHPRAMIECGIAVATLPTEEPSPMRGSVVVPAVAIVVMSAIVVPPVTVVDVSAIVVALVDGNAIVSTIVVSPVS
jgi:hypothetical protein